MAKNKLDDYDYSDLNPYEYYVNTKYTTEKDLFRRMSIDYLTPDYYKGIREWKGVVLKAVDAFMEQDESAYLSETDSTYYQKCKVRAFKLHSHLPVLNYSNQNSYDESIIELYPDFIYEYKSNNGYKLKIGDRVIVSYKNLHTKQDPYIVGLDYSAQNVPSDMQSLTKIREIFSIGASFSSQDSSGDPSVDRNFPGLSQKAQDYENFINEASDKFRINKNLIKAVIAQESSYSPNATSGAGAQGLMQLMPGTFGDMKKKYGIDGDIKDPKTNIFAGTAYLRHLSDIFQEDTVKVIAAYNYGDGNVKKALKKNDWYSYIKINIKETSKYLEKVSAYYKKFSSS